MKTRFSHSEAAEREAVERLIRAGFNRIPLCEEMTDYRHDSGLNCRLEPRDTLWVRWWFSRRYVRGGWAADILGADWEGATKVALQRAAKNPAFDRWEIYVLSMTLLGRDVLAEGATGELQNKLQNTL